VSTDLPHVPPQSLPLTEAALNEARRAEGLPPVTLLKAARRRWPVTAKTHGAWLGAGTGSALAAGVAGLIQTYLTHRTLPAADVSLIYTASTALVAFIGSYVAPNQDRSGDNQAPLPPA
jgi:hypothetical protein